MEYLGVVQVYQEGEMTYKRLGAGEFFPLGAICLSDLWEERKRAGGGEKGRAPHA